MSIALSALLKKPIKIIKIRAGRKNCGLAAQHLNGMIKNLAIKTNEIRNHHLFGFFSLYRRHWIGQRSFECKCKWFKNWINRDWISTVRIEMWWIYCRYKNGWVNKLRQDFGNFSIENFNWHANESIFLMFEPLQEYSIITSSCIAVGTFWTFSISFTLERRYKCWNGATNRFYNRNFPIKFGTIRCHIRFYIATKRVTIIFC